MKREFKNHNEMIVDMLAETYRRDYKKRKYIENLLRSKPGNIFDQKTLSGLACGTKLKDGAKNLWNIECHTGCYSYHIPFDKKSYSSLKEKEKKKISWDSITYNDNFLKLGRQKIVELLSIRIPVRAGVIYKPKLETLKEVNGVYQFQPNHSGGHYILIIGHNGNGTKFLYIDPYEKMSSMIYRGGPLPIIPNKKGIADEAIKIIERCNYLGIISLQDKKTKEGNCKVLAADSLSTINYISGRIELIGGPKWWK